MCFKVANSTAIYAARLNGPLEICLKNNVIQNVDRITGDGIDHCASSVANLIKPLRS